MSDAQRPDFAAINGWDIEAPDFRGPGEPSYVGGTTFCKRPLVEDAAGLGDVDVAIVGAPYDDGTSFRPGARFGPRAIRAATYTPGTYSLQLDVAPWRQLGWVDAGDADVTPGWPERSHARIFEKVLQVASAGVVPITFGGDHSITWPAASAVAQARAPVAVGIVHFDAHADTADTAFGISSGHGSPMRRLIESGAIAGRNFVQVGLRGYWPPEDVLAWMAEQGMRWHLMREIEERGAEAVVDDAIEEALDRAELIYLSVDVDVIDPGMAPGTGTPEPGGLLTRELLRAVRRVASSVRLAGMDIVEVSPPYDHAEVTATAAHRIALEAISALAARSRDGMPVRFPPTD